MRRPSREAVLTILGDEEQTSAVIAQRLGSSPSAVQRQLIELEAEGRVTHGISNRGVTWRKAVEA